MEILSVEWCLGFASKIFGKVDIYEKTLALSW